MLRAQDIAPKVLILVLTTLGATSACNSRDGGSPAGGGGTSSGGESESGSGGLTTGGTQTGGSGPGTGGEGGHAPEQCETTVSWAAQLPDSRIGALVLDMAGNVVAAGTVRSSTGYDVTVGAYTLSGDQLWAWQLGTEGLIAQATALGLNADDTIYFAGDTTPKDLELRDPDGFVSKYAPHAQHPQGEEQWTRILKTEPYRSEYVNDLVLDGSGNIVVVGSTDGELEGKGAGQTDAFLRKYDSNGNILWTRLFGRHLQDNALGVIAGPGDRLFIAGVTEVALESEATGEAYAFVRSYDAGGQLLWTREMVSGDIGQALAWETSFRLALDGNESLYLVGTTSAQLGAEHFGKQDAFVRKYSLDGDELWTRQFGTEADDTLAAIALDEDGQVYVAGATKGDLEAGNEGGFDIFVRKYSAAGELRWTKQLGTEEDDAARALIVGACDAVFVAGSTRGAFVGESSGRQDAFVMRLATPR